MYVFVKYQINEATENQFIKDYLVTYIHISYCEFSIIPRWHILGSLLLKSHKWKELPKHSSQNSQ